MFFWSSYNNLQQAQQTKDRSYVCTEEEEEEEEVSHLQ